MLFDHFFWQTEINTRWKRQQQVSDGVAWLNWWWIWVVLVFARSLKSRRELLEKIVASTRFLYKRETRFLVPNKRFQHAIIEVRGCTVEEPSLVVRREENPSFLLGFL